MADLRIQYTEEMVGAQHPTKADTLNRLTLIEHNSDGTHGPSTFSSSVKYSKGSNIVSTAALPIPVDGSYFDVTGTATITGIVTNGVGTRVILHFTGILTLTNSATLVLPNGSDITTVAGDVAEFYEFATGSWILVSKSNDNPDTTAISGEAVLSSNYVGTTSWSDTGLTITLPTIGTYLLMTAAVGSATKAAAATNTQIFCRLFVSGGALVANSEFEVFRFDDPTISAFNSGGASASQTLITTTVANTIIKLQMRGAGTTAPTAITLQTSADYKTKMNYIKVA